MIFILPFADRHTTYGEYTWYPIYQGGGGPSPQHPGDQGGARHRGDLPPQPGL